MQATIIAVLAYLCQSLPITSYCEQYLTTPEPPAPPSKSASASPSAMTVPITLPTKAELVAKLERDAKVYVATSVHDHKSPSVRRPASLRLRRDLRALARIPITPEERREVCANEALGRVRDAITAQPNAKIMKAYLTRACVPAAGDNYVARTLSRFALYAGQSFVKPRPNNAFARAQAREWLKFIIARGDLGERDWRAVLAYAPDATKNDQIHPELWGAALADAVDGDWSKLGLNDSDVMVLARRALGDLSGRARKRRLERVQRAYYLTLQQVAALEADAPKVNTIKADSSETDRLAAATKALGNTTGRARLRKLHRIKRKLHLTPAQVNALKMSGIEPPRRDDNDDD